MATKNDGSAAELRRLRDIFRCVGEERFKVIEPMLEDLAFQRTKLADAREQFANTPLVLAYDNGGGQRGIRENPAIKAYNQLFRTYSDCIMSVVKLLPEQEQAKVSDEDSEIGKWLMQEVKRAKKTA